MRLFKKILPIDFYQIGDNIIIWMRKKKNLEAGIVDITFENLGGHMYRVVCNITYKDAGQLKRATGIVNTTITNEDTPMHISKSIEDGSCSILKFNEDDLEVFNNDMEYDLKFRSNWRDIINECHKKNISFVNLTDRGFYTLMEFCNLNGTVISCLRIGIIDKIPTDISDQLYPFKTYKFAL